MCKNQPRIPQEFKDFLKNDCDVQDLLALLKEAKELKDNCSIKAINDALKECSID